MKFATDDALRKIIMETDQAETAAARTEYQIATGVDLEMYWDNFLRHKYEAYAARFGVACYGGTLPSLGPDFSVRFLEFPKEIFWDDWEGITLLPTFDRHVVKEALAAGVNPGIYINARFRGLSGASCTVLLHEMVHASGILGHGQDFDDVREKLYIAKAFANAIEPFSSLPCEL